MITRATPDDTPHIVRLAQRHHAASGAPGAFHEGAMDEYFRGLFEMGGAVFMSDAGLIYGFISPLYYDPFYRVALEVGWYAEDGQGMALLALFERWAERQGAQEIRMSSMSAHRGGAVNRLLRRRGYRPAETSLRKVIA